MENTNPTVDHIEYKDNLLFVHESNLVNKYKTDYKGRSKEIRDFYFHSYLKMRERALGFTFDDNHREDFVRFAKVINNYYRAVESFTDRFNITSQSKFASTFLEEISTYLFKDIPEIKTGEFGIFNKNVYAGLKLDSEKRVSVITKDVDFCIGKKVEVSISDKGGNDMQISIIVPIVAVEVKTYLDATMFGEIKSSSGAIRSASPNSRTYVLMGYKDLKDDHLIAARQDPSLTEMFALREGQGKPVDASALYDYWKEVHDAINDVSSESIIKVPGRLLHPDE